MRKLATLLWLPFTRALVPSRIHRDFQRRRIPETLLSAPHDQVFALCQISSSTQTCCELLISEDAASSRHPGSPLGFVENLLKGCLTSPTTEHLSTSSQNLFQSDFSPLALHGKQLGSGSPVTLALLTPTSVLMVLCSLKHTVNSLLKTCFWRACQAPGVPPHLLAVLSLSLG